MTSVFTLTDAFNDIKVQMCHFAYSLLHGDAFSSRSTILTSKIIMVEIQRIFEVTQCIKRDAGSFSEESVNFRSIKQRQVPGDSSPLLPPRAARISRSQLPTVSSQFSCFLHVKE